MPKSGLLTKAYLELHYLKLQKSATEIATELGVNPNTVVRALKKYGIHVRGKNEAQALALKTGRATHPKQRKKANGSQENNTGT